MFAKHTKKKSRGGQPVGLNQMVYIQPYCIYHTSQKIYCATQYSIRLAIKQIKKML